MLWNYYLITFDSISMKQVYPVFQQRIMTNDIKMSLCLCERVECCQKPQKGHIVALLSVTFIF